MDETLGCYYYDKNMQLKELALGGSVDVGIMRHHCEPDPAVKGRVKYLVHGTIFLVN